MPGFLAARPAIGVASRPWLPQDAIKAMRTFPRSYSSATPSPTARPVVKSNPPFKPAAQPSRPASSDSPRESKSPTTAASSAALRTAEARESALRAARLRRQGQEQDRLAEEERKKEDKREYQARYKAAGRRWISSMIALPILLVTSYYLFDRLMLGHAPKELPRFKDKDKTDR